MTVLILVAVALWLVAGFAGCTYWWSAEWDERPPLWLALFVAVCLGGAAWLVGYFIHGKGAARRREYRS